MTIFGRRLLGRFAFSCGRILLVLVWLAAFIHLPAILGKESLDAVTAWKFLEELLYSLEIALFFAAPLGVVHVLSHLRKESILTVFMASHLGPGRLRRVLLLTSFLAVVLAVVSFQASSSIRHTLRKRSPGALWTSGTVTAWCPEKYSGESGPTTVFLFRKDRLDVSIARQVQTTANGIRLEMAGVEPLVGEPILVDEVSVKPAMTTLLTLPPPSSWLSPSVSVSDVLVALNRVAIPGFLVLLLAYAALLMPLSRQWYILPAFLLLLPTVCRGMVWCSLALWKQGSAGLLSEAGWIALLAGTIIILDRILSRRGLRIL